MFLAYTRGVIHGLLNAESVLNEDDRRTLALVTGHLYKAQKEAWAILNSI